MNRSQSTEIDLGGDRQRLGNNIDIDREEDVDLSCDECRYNCYPPFDSILLADMDFNNTVLLFRPSFGGIPYILARVVTLVLRLCLLGTCHLEHMIPFIGPSLYLMCQAWNSFVVGTNFFCGRFFGRSLTTSR